MKLFQIKVNLRENGKTEIYHKVFLDDDEELKFRREMDHLTLIGMYNSDYQMLEKDLNHVNVLDLEGMNIKELKKLLDNLKEE